MGKISPSATAVLATYGTLLTIALILIIARFYLRIKIHRNRRLLASDLLMGAAWCAGVATASFDIVFYKRGALEPELDYTLRNFDTSIENYEYVTKMVWASVIPFYATIYLCKLSLLAVYFQLFPIFMVKLRIALWVTLGLCISSWMVSMGVHVFLCWPVHRMWEVSRPDNMCSPRVPQTIFQVGWGLQFAGSLAIFILPFFVMHKVRLRRRVMLAIYSTLSLGAIDIAFSLTRFLIVQLTNVGDFRSINTIELWSALDIMVGLIVTCLPSLRPFLRRNFKASSASDSYGLDTITLGSSQGITVNHQVMTSNTSRLWGERTVLEDMTHNEASGSGNDGIPRDHVVVIGNNVQVSGGKAEGYKSGSKDRWQEDIRSKNSDKDLM